MWPQEQHLCKFLQALHSCIMGKKSYKCYKLYGAQGWMWLCIAPVSAPDHDSQLSEWQVVPSIFLLIAQNKQLTPSILWMGQAALGQWVVAFRKIMVHLVKPDDTGSWPETFQWLVPVWIPAGGFGRMIIKLNQGIIIWLKILLSGVRADCVAHQSYHFEWSSRALIPSHRSDRKHTDPCCQTRCQCHQLTHRLPTLTLTVLTVDHKTASCQKKAMCTQVML